MRMTDVTRKQSLGLIVPTLFIICSSSYLRADTILFDDLLEPVVVPGGPNLIPVIATHTDAGGTVTPSTRWQQLTTGPSLGEVVVGNLLAPTGSHLVSTTLPNPGSIEITEGPPVGIAEQSDSLDVTALSTSVNLVFGSDADGVALPLTNCAIATCISESGNTQPLGIVTWSDGTVDTIQFRSDPNIPETTSIVLSSTALVIIGISVRARLRRKKTY
jgi:hypothetical protein